MGSLFLCLVLLVPNVSTITLTSSQVEDPLFSVTIFSHSGNDARLEWNNLIAENWRELGINVTVDVVTAGHLWFNITTNDDIYILNNDNITKPLTYNEGGFDITDWGFYRSTHDFFFWDNGFSNHSLPPCTDGVEDTCNYFVYQNSTVNTIFEEGLAVYSDLPRTFELVKELQSIFYEDIPTSIIFEDVYPMIAHPDLGLSNIEAIGIKSGILDDEWKTLGSGSISNITIGTVQAYDETRFSPYKQPFIFSNREEFSKSMVWEPLYSRNIDDARWEPLLADNIPLRNENHTKIMIKIRSDVNFADGHALDVYDIVTTYEVLMDEELGIFSHGTNALANPMIGVTAVNSSWVQFEFEKPVLNNFEYHWLSFGIVPEHIFGNLTDPNYTNSPEEAVISETNIYGIGTGPYIYDSFQSNISYQMKPNPNYWNGFVRNGNYNVKLNLSSEPSDQINLIQSNEIDLLLDPAFGANQFKDKEDVQVFLTTLDLNVGFALQYNHNHPIFGTGIMTPLGMSNPESATLAARFVRQALNYAIPRQQIVDEIVNGDGIPGTTRVLSTQFGHDPQIQSYEFDLAKGRELLRKAGYDVPEPKDEQSSSNNTPALLLIYLIGGSLILVTGSLVIQWISNTQRKLQDLEDPDKKIKDYLKHAMKNVEKNDL